MGRGAGGRVEEEVKWVWGNYAGFEAPGSQQSNVMLAIGNVDLEPEGSIMEPSLGITGGADKFTSRTHAE